MLDATGPVRVEEALTNIINGITLRGRERARGLEHGPSDNIQKGYIMKLSGKGDGRKSLVNNKKLLSLMRPLPAKGGAGRW